MDAVSLEHQIASALQDMPAAITDLIAKARAVEAKQRELDAIDREILENRSKMCALVVRMLRAQDCWQDTDAAVVAGRLAFMRWAYSAGGGPVMKTDSAVIEAVDPLLADVLAWANEKPDDRLDPMWFYAYADLVRALERYRRGQP